MNIQRWEKLKALFETGSELPAAEREVYLDKISGTDDTLRSELAYLFVCNDAAGQFLSGPFVPSEGTPSFGTGELVANRYRIVSRIGTGGMGEVYEAIDTQLNQSIALKTVRADALQNDQGFERLQLELRTARKVTHPNVCRVFDIGKHHQGPGEILFLTMELLRGETLAAWLARDTCLPVQRVLTIGRLIAAGIDAAHSLNIVHRDLKPANVFITSDARVVVTDFGLARDLGGTTKKEITRAGVIIGTPAYMAPELLSGGAATKASDTYAFAVMIFEMVTGRRPTDDKPSAQPLPTLWRAAMDSALLADPAIRLATPRELIQRLEGQKSAPTTRRTMGLWLAVIVVLIVVYAAAGFVGKRQSQFTNSDATHKSPSVLLGSIENLTGNPAYDFTATQLLVVAMEQSRYVNTLSQFHLLEALNRAGRSPGERLTRELALEIGKREGVDVVISGDISTKGRSSELELVAAPVSPATGSKLLRASLSGPEELPAVIEKMTAELRTFFGESPSQIGTSSVPLEKATTQSAVAWERYSTAMLMESQKRFGDEINLLQSAIELDPEFAVAYATLGIQQNNIGNTELGLANVSRAYELKNRTTEHERYAIQGMYYTLRYEFEKATEAFRRLATLYPFDDVAARSLTQALCNQLLVSDAIQEGRRAVALNPRSYLTVGALAIALLQAGQNDGAITVIKQQGNDDTLLEFEGQAWLGKDDIRAAEQLFRKMISLGGTDENSANKGLAESLLMEGRLDDAASQLESALVRSQRIRDSRSFFKLHAWLSWVYVLQGRDSLARMHAAAIADAPATPAVLRELRTAALLTIDQDELSLADKFIKTISDFASAYDSNCYRGILAELRGEQAWRRGDMARARQEFERAMTQWPDAVNLWSAARFFESAGEPERSRNLYAEVLSRKGEIIRWHFPGIFALSQLGQARMESKLSNRAEALKDYGAFLATFGRFSPGLRIVKDAAAELDRLSSAQTNPAPGRR